MDFPKFVSLLEESALYFPQIKNLGDPFEGSISNRMVEGFRDVPDEHRGRVESNLQTIGLARSLVRASCWHMNDEESAAMWSLYAQRGQGIAIRSTIGRAKAAVQDTPEEVYIGLVQYFNYDTDDIPWDNSMKTAHCKRCSFAHEREVRLTVFDPGSDSPGTLVKVTLPELIEGILVAPQSPNWLERLVQRVLNRYGINMDITRSRIEEQPTY